jgi:hypothetical protein
MGHGRGSVRGVSCLAARGSSVDERSRRQKVEPNELASLVDRFLYHASVVIKSLTPLCMYLGDSPASMWVLSLVQVSIITCSSPVEDELG